MTMSSFDKSILLQQLCMKQFGKTIGCLYSSSGYSSGMPWQLIIILLLSTEQLLPKTWTISNCLLLRRFCIYIVIQNSCDICCCYFATNIHRTVCAMMTLAMLFFCRLIVMAYKIFPTALDKAIKAI